MPQLIHDGHNRFQLGATGYYRIVYRGGWHTSKQLAHTRWLWWPTTVVHCWNNQPQGRHTRAGVYPTSGWQDHVGKQRWYDPMEAPAEGPRGESLLQREDGRLAGW
jgi:hypothetical protein